MWKNVSRSTTLNRLIKPVNRETCKPHNLRECLYKFKDRILCRNKWEIKIIKAIFRQTSLYTAFRCLGLIMQRIIIFISIMHHFVLDNTWLKCRQRSGHFWMENSSSYTWPLYTVLVSLHIAFNPLTWPKKSLNKCVLWFSCIFFSEIVQNFHSTSQPAR